MTKRAGERSASVVRLHSGIQTCAPAMGDEARWRTGTVPHSASQSPMRRHPPNAMAIGPRRIQTTTNPRTEWRERLTG